MTCISKREGGNCQRLCYWEHRQHSPPSSCQKNIS